MYRVRKDDFMTIKKSIDSWVGVLEKAYYKEIQKQGDFIRTTTDDIRKNIEKTKKKEDLQIKRSTV